MLRVNMQELGLEPSPQESGFGLPGSAPMGAPPTHPPMRVECAPKEF